MTCNLCNGSGEVVALDFEFRFETIKPCPACLGEGEIQDSVLETETVLPAEVEETVF